MNRPSSAKSRSNRSPGRISSFHVSERGSNRQTECSSLCSLLIHAIDVPELHHVLDLTYAYRAHLDASRLTDARDAAPEAVYLAHREIEMPAGGEVVLEVGHFEAVQVWLEDDRVASFERGDNWQLHKITLRGKPGPQRLGIAACLTQACKNMDFVGFWSRVGHG